MMDFGPQAVSKYKPGAQFGRRIHMVRIVHPNLKYLKAGIVPTNRRAYYGQLAGQILTIKTTSGMIRGQ
jgi:hypothetical protein